MDSIGKYIKNITSINKFGKLFINLAILHVEILPMNIPTQRIRTASQTTTEITILHLIIIIIILGGLGKTR